MRNMWKRVLALALAAMMLSGCAQNTAGDAVQAMAAASAADQSGDASSSEVTLEDEMVALAAGPGAIDPSLTTSAPGTLAKKNDLASYRQALSFITKEDVAKKLFSELNLKYQGREGGYTRVVKIGPRRGDAAEMAIVQLV